MTFFLSAEEALLVVSAAMGQMPQVRDYGLLQAALVRPQTQLFGDDAYPELHLKAAALLHSLVKNHCLVDGNKRLGFACAAVFLAVNGKPLTLSQDDAYRLTMAVAAGELDDLKAIASVLE